METKRMTRLSATATIAALLLLAIVQGFGATSSTKSTKSSPKVATKSTAKPYHVTAQNQFHKQMANPNAKASRVRKTTALDRVQSKALQNRAIGSHGPLGPAGRSAGRDGDIHAQSQIRARSPQQGGPSPFARPRRQQANPPTGHLGFVSATQISAQGLDYGAVQAGAMGTATAFITVVAESDAGPCAGGGFYSEVVANGDGTFTPLVPTAPVTLTPTVSGSCTPNFIFADVNGDGNSDIVEAYVIGGVSTIAVLLSNGDGTFSPAPATTLGPASPLAILPNNGFTGGTLIMNATTGFLDLVIVDDGFPSSITTYAGNGDGTFTAVLTPGVAASSVALAPPTDPVYGLLDGVGYNVIIEDLNGDGAVDVAENDDFTGQLTVYLNTVTAGVTTYPGAESQNPDQVYDACFGGAATAGSLTGSSGLPAIVEVNCGDDTITVYNNNAGVFSEGVYYPVVLASTSNGNGYPVAATIADVNGDGNGDIVVSDDDGGDVTILLGNGDGTVNSATVGYAVGGYPVAAAFVGDLNGDGLLDIVVADDNQGLVYMAGFGDGTFQAARTFYESIPDNSDNGAGNSIASGDFNGDGFTDVVVANCCNSTLGVTVFLSNPDGSLQPGVNYGTGGGMEYVTVADFNGDGKLDFAVSNGNNDTVDIYTGTGSGTFITGPMYSIGAGAEGIVSGTINAAGTTGFADLAVLTWSGASFLNVLLNDGTGGFAPVGPLALNAGGYELALAQLGNTAGTPAAPVTDVVIAETATASLAVLLGNGDGTFAAETDYPIGTQGVYGVAVADVNGDGFPDVAIAAYDPVVDGGGIAVFLGDGSGAFSDANALALFSTLEVSGVNYAPYPAEVQFVDVDGDGNLDLVYTNSNYGTVGVMFGTGLCPTVATCLPPPAPPAAATPFFFDPVEFPAGGYAYGLNVANITGDGTPAAVTANDDYAGASTLLNANGPAAAPNFSLAVTGQSSPAFLNIPAGGTATAMITLTPVNFYSGTVTFSCGGLPLDVTCAFAPATLTPVGNAPLSTTLTVTTAASHGALRMPADSNPHQGRTSLLACLTGMGLFGLLLSGDWKNKRNRRVGILLGILVLGMMFSLVGCSSSSTPGTPIGAQTIQVIGTGSDGTTNSVNITINVF
jgi:hypothetical protein